MKAGVLTDLASLTDIGDRPKGTAMPNGPAAPAQGFLFDLSSLVHDGELWIAAQRGAVEDFRGTWTTMLAETLSGQSLRGMAELISTATGAPSAGVRRALLTRFRALTRNGHLRVFHGALELLQELQRIGMPVGVVSTAPHTLTKHCLTAAGLLSYVKEIHCSRRDTRRRTPSDLHVIAARKLSIDPDVSVAIAHCSAGIRSARAAGLRTLADFTVPRPAGAHGHLDAYVPRDVAVLLKAAALPRAEGASDTASR